jgi:transcriptional regulator with XRE-family HTH domain
LKERLKKLRKALDLTQQEFADRIGISRGNIATYETRDGSPGNSVINLICREFNVNETWLRTGAGEMFVEAPSDTLDALVQEYHLDRFGRTVVEKMLNLNEKQWAVFHDFAMEVLESLSDGPAASSSTPVHTPAKEEEARAEAEPAADIASELAELKRQNQEMAAEIAAMKEEDAIKAAQSPSVSTGSFDPAQRAKK